MKRIFAIIAAMGAFTGTFCSSHTEPANDSPIAAKPKGATRIMTYNVGAIGKFVDESFTVENNVKLIADIVNESHTDVVAYQELDSCNARNNFFQLKAVAEATGKDWTYCYGPAIDYR